MFKLDNALLEELGLGSLPADEKNRMLAHIYETLEMRVGMKLAEQMSNEQLDEFEGFIDRSDEPGALKWLESNFPNYKDVVAEQLEKLKGEVKAAAPQILQAAQMQAQAAQAGQAQQGQVPAPQPGQPGTMPQAQPPQGMPAQPQYAQPGQQPMPSQQPMPGQQPMQQPVQPPMPQQPPQGMPMQQPMPPQPGQAPQGPAQNY